MIRKVLLKRCQLYCSYDECREIITSEYIGSVVTDDSDETYTKDGDIVMNAARFILNLKEKFKLSQVIL